jgi:hypothetical protein
MEDMAMKKLPVGIQTFREIIEGGYVYADKTEYVYRLATEGKYYFLSRPRRFGKSLLIDTLKELFEGNRRIFKDLWIDGSDYDFRSYPVIRLDMTQVNTITHDKLEETLSGRIKDMAREAGVDVEGSIASDCFIRLIKGLREKTGERVVVLIDEYDKPIIDHMDDPAAAASNREVLSSVYGVLKGQDENLRFVFITGVSKFTKTSIFSKLNNLTDLTVWDRYAGICGFTEDEFDAIFHEYVDAYIAEKRKRGHPDGDKESSEMRDEIFGWYDGYTWDGSIRVFNPFSLLSFFLKNKFAAYWYGSGIPTFLPQIFRTRPAEYVDLQGAVINETALDSYDIEKAPLESLLFQTGFLTIKSLLPGSPEVYALGFPNVEISQSFSQMFLESAAEGLNPLANTFIRSMREALDAGKPEDIEDSLRGLYASIPYQLHLPAEAFYHAMFIATMQFLGFRALGEVSVANGRIDGVIEQPNGMTYVIEFKYAKDDRDVDAALEEAMRQIGERRYADRYAGTRRRVFKVAIAVSGKGSVKVLSRDM